MTALAILAALIGLGLLAVCAPREDAFADTSRPGWPLLDHSEVP